MKAVHRTLLVLVLSHAVAAVSGAGLAFLHGSHVDENVDLVLRGVALSPLLDGAELAFRFAPPEQAEVLLNAPPIRDSNDFFEWGDTLMRDLRLAVVYKELGDAAAEDAALTSAVEACRLLKKRDCTLDSARRSASKFGEYRTP
jgi:hypothetical protein